MSDTAPSVVSPGPGPFVVSSGDNNHRGFNSSDASLIRAGQSYDAHITNLKETMENRFQIERSVKETERTLLNQLTDIKIQNAVQLGEFRNAMFAQIASVKDASFNAAQAELLFRRFLPTVTTP